MDHKQMRIVTRPDFDGMVCAALLQDALNIQQPVHWVEPNHLQRGLVDIQQGDIIANGAYQPGCWLWFDHHSSNQIKQSFKGSFKIAPSAARVIFDYYQGKFSRDFSLLVEAADKIDSASLSLSEVLDPQKDPYVLLAETISGFHQQDQAYWDHLVFLLKTSDIGKIHEDQEVKIRSQKAMEENCIYKKYLEENTKLVGNISITDFRSFSKQPSGNRFLVFSLFPQTNVNVKIRMDRIDNERLVVSIGHSIFNRTCRTDVGKLCSRFNGGGHRGAGSCSFPISESDEILQKIITCLLER